MTIPNSKPPFRLPWKIDESKQCIRDADDNYLIEDSDMALLEFIVTAINLTNHSEIKRVIHNIKNELYAAYPELSNYQVSETIKEMVEYFQRANDSKNRDHWLGYREYTRVHDWENIRKQITDDILGGDPTWFDKKEHRNKTNFERGVLAAIALITHRIDCIVD